MPEEISENPQPVTESKPTSWPKVILVAVLGFGLLTGAAYAGYWYGTESANLKTQSAKLPPKTQAPENPTSEPTPTPTPLVENQTDESSIRKIDYAKIDGWVDFVSPTGYSFQHPLSLLQPPTLGPKEFYEDGVCSISGFADESGTGGGAILSKVVTYSGGSLRELYGISEDYQYRFEEAIIQGNKSLIIEEAKPTGFYKLTAGVVIPVGKHALILSWVGKGRDDPDFTKLLRSVKINDPLGLTKCGQ